MLVCEVMDRGVPSVKPTDSVRSVVVKIISRGTGVVPVVEEDGKLVGVISIRDVMLPLFPNYGDYVHDRVNSRDFEEMESGYPDLLKKSAEDIMTPNPMSVSQYDPLLKAASYQGSQPWILGRNTRSPTLSDRDTSITNPTASTIVREVRRFLINSAMLLRDGFGATVQMVFRESWSCPTTPPAPTSKVTMPMRVARMLELGVLTFWIIVWIAWAPSGPTSPCIVLMICC